MAELNEYKNEIWKDIENFEGKYQISNFGRVKTLKRKFVYKTKIMKLKNDKDGYKLINLNITRVGKITLKVHRMVANAFIPNPKMKPMVNHKNLVKFDNRIENLEWVTRAENMKHAKENGAWD